VETQIHADSKRRSCFGWHHTDHCTYCHASTISRFHLIAHCVSGGGFFTENYIRWHSLHFGIIFDPRAAAVILTVTLTWPMTFWTQNQQASTDWWRLLLCQISSHSDQRFSSYHANIHTHTPLPHTYSHTHPNASRQSDRNIRAAVLRRRRG